MNDTGLVDKLREGFRLLKEDVFTVLEIVRALPGKGNHGVPLTAACHCVREELLDGDALLCDDIVCAVGDAETALAEHTPGDVAAAQSSPVWQ